MQLVNIGFGNLLNTGRILALLSPESQPVKRMVQEAKAACTVIDATHGRKTLTVLLLDSGHTVLSYLPPEKIAARLGMEQIEKETADAQE
ncbi:MAG: DUF370 domain-containing protein [Oscillospiraceae bacterium]|jgi:regulator of extracellular matrix RemA (YlzA/DUF370 family)|nr:DUF370 domain-containing protein [Oscillospiraceae bacterium]